MDKEFIDIEKEIDEKIEQLKECQGEIQCCIKSLEQMHQSATNLCKTIENLEKQNG